MLTRVAWEMYRDTATRPNLADMTTFLERRATGLAGVPSTKPIDTICNNKPREWDVDVPVKPYRSGTFERKQPTSERTSLLPPCPMCKADHGLFKCSQFLTMKFDARMDFVRKTSLCQNCLRTGHSVEKCPKQQFACRNCKGELHNSTICPKRKQIIDNQKQRNTAATHAIAPFDQMPVLEKTKPESE